MRHKARRQDWGTGGVLGSLLVLAAVWPCYAQEARFDGITLRLATYGGSYRDLMQELIGKELEKRGGNIEYVIGAPRDHLAKLIAARGRDVPFDVMELDDPVKADMLELKLLEELDYAKLPNVSHLIESGYRDRYTVVAWVTHDGIIYNQKKFQELGIPKPEIRDLFNPKLAGKVAFPDVTYPDAITGIVAFAIQKGGDESNIGPGLALIKELNAVYFYKSFSELSTKFASGDVWAAWHYGGGALRLRRSGIPAGISFPTISKDTRGVLLPGLLGIPKGGKARAAAEFFINRYFDNDVMAALAKRHGVGPVKAEVLPKLLSDAELNDVTLLTPTQIKSMYHIDWAKVNFRDWIEKWNRAVAQ